MEAPFVTVAEQLFMSPLWPRMASAIPVTHKGGFNTPEGVETRRATIADALNLRPADPAYPGKLPGHDTALRHCVREPIGIVNIDHGPIMPHNRGKSSLLLHRRNLS